MRTLIQHIDIIPLDDVHDILTDSTLAIDGTRLVGVGSQPDGFVPDEQIDGRGLVALPALFNAHTHAAMTLERGWAEDLPFERWLNEKIWVAESALEEEDVYWGAALAGAEMLRAGTIGFADHYFWMDQVARFVEESGMKALLAWCHFGNALEQELGKISFDDTTAFVRRWKGAAGGRIHTTMGPHSPYMVPAPVLERFAAEAQRAGVGVHLHVSESQEQVATSIKRYGVSPVVQLASLGLMDLPEPTLFAHCCVLDETDIRLLAGKKVYVAHTPKTYQKLGMAMPPLRELVSQGVQVAFGTDGPASNSDLNLIEVMRIAGQHQKFAHADPQIFPRQQLIRMASAVSAAAMGFPESGMLAAGRPADLILVDTTAPHWIPRNDLAAGFVYTAHPGDVAYVWSDGRLLYRKGEYLTLDIDRIRWEAEKRAFRMVGKPMAAMRVYPGG